MTTRHAKLAKPIPDGIVPLVKVACRNHHVVFTFRVEEGVPRYVVEVIRTSVNGEAAYVARRCYPTSHAKEARVSFVEEVHLRGGKIPL